MYTHTHTHAHTLIAQLQHKQISIMLRRKKTEQKKPSGT
jgi:hypothetical protein